MIRVGLNGCGRIGRLVLRGLLQSRGSLEVVALNEVADVQALASSLRRDTLHGEGWESATVLDGERLSLSGKEIRVSSAPQPQECPWKARAVDLVVEATGRFTRREEAEGHRVAGAERVVVTAPLLGASRPDLQLVPGVNDTDLTPEARIVSLASCTTNCAAPILKVLHETWGVVSTQLTTVHAYTGDQVLLDRAHPDPRRARAAALNIIPTTTKAETAMQEVLPWTRGRLEAISYRVPAPGGSLVELVCVLEQEGVEAAAINRVLESASAPGGVIETTREPLVSWDVLGCRASALVDTELTRALPGRLVKVVAWYDNESGYAARVVETVERLAEVLTARG